MIHRTAAHRFVTNDLMTASVPLGLPVILAAGSRERMIGSDLRLDGETLGRKRSKRRVITRIGTPPAAVPQSAASIGQGERFRYWQGASGRRYLFSRVELVELSTFADAVVILLTADGAAARPTVLVGEIDQEGTLRGPDGAPLMESADIAYVHLLARDSEARTAVMDDIIAAG